MAFIRIILNISIRLMLMTGENKRTLSEKKVFILFSLILVPLLVTGSFAYGIVTAGNPGNSGLGTSGMVGKLSASVPAASSLTELNDSLPFIPSTAIQVPGLNLQSNISVFLGLQLQNVPMLNSLLLQISTPSSLLYRHYISHEEFVNMFEPNVTVYSSIVKYYEGYGLHFTQTNDRLYISLSGEIQNFEKAFNTNISLFNVGGRVYYFNYEPIYVPSNFSTLITSAIGFTNYTYITPALMINPASGLNASEVFSIGDNGFGGAASPQPPYTPYALQLAYNETGLLARGFSGQYITVAVTDAYGDPTAVTDLATFDSLYNQPAPSSFQVLYPYGSLNLYGDVQAVEQEWEIETSLDIEMSHTFAPGANILSVVTPDAGYTLVQSIVYLITNQLANVISNSWGEPEPEVGSQATYLHPFLEMAAAEGITVLAASGDQGAAGYDSAVPRSVMWPSSDPFVTAVGGTTLFMNGTISTGVQNPLNGPPEVTEVFVPTGWQNETAWDGYTGGGYSILFGRPFWQYGYGIPSTGPYVGMRGVPDVAANAMFGGNDFVFNGLTAGSYLFGGTSFASPMWAGIIATIDSYVSSVQGGLVGFVNPTLYSILNSPVYNESFHDIKYGFNGPNGYFNAGPGWSPVTGMGSPNIGFLANELAEYSFSAGVQSDFSASHNHGASVSISTVIPERVVGNSANYFYLSEELSDGTTIDAGYTVSNSVPDGSWFYSINPPSSQFGTEMIMEGPDGSVGVNGTTNTFGILYVGGSIWEITLNGNEIGSFSDSSTDSGPYSPYFLGTAAGVTDTFNVLGPAEFSSMEVALKQGILQVQSVKTVEMTDISSTFPPPYAMPNPYGVKLVGNHVVEIGSGIPPSNKIVLWGSFQYPPVQTVLQKMPQYVSLYAQNITSGTSSTSFPLTTVFPAGQSDFNSFYLVPVLGPSSWGFSLNSSTTDTLFLSQNSPIYVHFFVSLATSQNISSPGLVPLTVAVVSHYGSTLIGSGEETLNLSLTGNVTEYNVTFLPQVDTIPADSFISMTVSWFTASASGESVSYGIVLHSGQKYPISISLPILNPVDIAPLSFNNGQGSVDFSSVVTDPFGGYDLKSITGSINGVNVQFSTNNAGTYSWIVPYSLLKAGSNEFSVIAEDIQGKYNNASVEYTFVPPSYPVTFVETGLPAGMTWAVTFNGQTMTSSTSQIGFTSYDGTFSYSVGGIRGYAATPSSGTVVVNGAPVQVAIQFSSTSTFQTSAYSFVNSSSIYPYALPGAEEFTVSGSGTYPLNYVTLNLQGSGEIEFSIGTSLWHDQVLGNVTVSTSEGKLWYNTTIPTVYLQGGQNYFLNVFLVSGNVQWGYTSTPSSQKNNVADYWYASGKLYSDNAYPDIYSLGFQVGNQASHSISDHSSLYAPAYIASQENHPSFPLLVRIGGPQFQLTPNSVPGALNMFNDRR